MFSSDKLTKLTKQVSELREEIFFVMKDLEELKSQVKGEKEIDKLTKEKIVKLIYKPYLPNRVYTEIDIYSNSYEDVYGKKIHLDKDLTCQEEIETLYSFFSKNNLEHIKMDMLCKSFFDVFKKEFNLNDDKHVLQYININFGTNKND